MDSLRALRPAAWDRRRWGAFSLNVNIYDLIEFLCGLCSRLKNETIV